MYYVFVVLLFVYNIILNMKKAKGVFKKRKDVRVRKSSLTMTVINQTIGKVGVGNKPYQDNQV